MHFQRSWTFSNLQTGYKPIPVTKFHYLCPYFLTTNTNPHLEFSSEWHVFGYRLVNNSYCNLSLALVTSSSSRVSNITAGTEDGLWPRIAIHFFKELTCLSFIIMVFHCLILFFKVFNFVSALFPTPNISQLTQFYSNFFIVSNSTIKLLLYIFPSPQIAKKALTSSSVQVLPRLPPELEELPIPLPLLFIL